MIIEWQSNIAAFAGNHQYWWVGQPAMWQPRVSVTSETIADPVILANVGLAGRQGARSVTGQQSANAISGRQPGPTATGQV